MAIRPPDLEPAAGQVQALGGPALGPRFGPMAPAAALRPEVTAASEPVAISSALGGPSWAVGREPGPGPGRPWAAPRWAVAISSAGGPR